MTRRKKVYMDLPEEEVRLVQYEAERATVASEAQRAKQRRGMLLEAYRQSEMAKTLRARGDNVGAAHAEELEADYLKSIERLDAGEI